MKDFQLIHIRDHQVEDREKLHKWIDYYLDQRSGGGDKDIEIWFADTDKTRSQNNYYWVNLTKIARKFGTIATELHDYLKKRFLPDEKYIVLIVDKKPDSTKGLDKDEMGEYMDRCSQWSAEELGFVWVDPEEYKHRYK